MEKRSLCLIIGVAIFLNIEILNFGKVEEIDCMIDLYTLSTEESGKLKDWLHRSPCITNFKRFYCTILYTPFFSRQIPVFDLDAVI